MALNIRDREVHELARKVAEAAGETMTQAVKTALAERLQRVAAASAEEQERQVEAMLAFAREWRSREALDPRSPAAILGYDEHGLPS